ncbi:MAG: hypothetical protein ACE37N_09855 [Pseudohongiellaceae bacterium]
MRPTDSKSYPTLHRMLSSCRHPRDWRACGLTLALALALALLPHTPLQAQQGASEDGWDAYGADLGSTKYSPLTQINSDNVTQLEIAWRRPALDSYYRDINPEQRFTSNWVGTPRQERDSLSPMALAWLRRSIPAVGTPCGSRNLRAAPMACRELPPAVQPTGATAMISAY